MQIKHGILAVATGLLVLAFAALADDPATEFARVSRDATGRSEALQTAIVTYVPAADSGRFSVDLIGAVHLGDSEYYAELNQQFRHYDALLYELVAPAGSAVTKKDSGSKGMLSNAQTMLGTLLGLSFQLDEINYDAANFVHADLSPEELRNSMAERNESLYVYFWRLYFVAMEDFSRDPYGVDNLAKVLSSGRGYDVKTAFAYELADASKSGDILAGDTGSALIAARNDRALEVLQDEIDSRKRRIGIFYGAAHLPDLEQRLISDFGLLRTDVVWVDAWRLDDDVALTTGN